MTEVFSYLHGLGFAPSDWAFVALVFPVVWFLFVYGVLTKWWVDPLGWFVLLMALSTALLLLLIVYAMFTGTRVVEPVRFIVVLMLIGAWVGKSVVLHYERAAGKMEKRRGHDATGPIRVFPERKRP